MYRILASAGETKERRFQRAPRKIAAPRLVARSSNEVWTWDITKLRSLIRGQWYCLYVIIDLYSRFVVGWTVAKSEDTRHAKKLFSEACARHQIEPKTLTIHSDRGSVRTSDGLVALYERLGLTRSLSRPRVSNDNAYSESQFKTLKYQLDYPERFESLYHARGWLQQFFSWYNDVHCHSGLALFTPAQIFHNKVSESVVVRQNALDAIYAEHPERFVNGAPCAVLPPDKVCINLQSGLDSCLILPQTRGVYEKA